MAAARLLSLALVPALSLAGQLSQTKTILSAGRKIHVDVYCGEPSKAAAIVVFLHGSGGPRSPGIPYAGEVQRLADEGYCVFLPHFLDATRGSPAEPESHYSVWVRTVEDSIAWIADFTRAPKEQMALAGYSLGGMVALATAVRNPELGAVIAISGNLPDEFYRSMTTLPALLIVHGRDDEVVPVSNAIQLAALCKSRNLVCQSEIYPGERHSFSAEARVRLGNEIEAFLREHLKRATKKPL